MDHFILHPTSFIHPHHLQGVTLWILQWHVQEQANVNIRNFYKKIREAVSCLVSLSKSRHIKPILPGASYTLYQCFPTGTMGCLEDESRVPQRLNIVWRRNKIKVLKTLFTYAVMSQLTYWQLTVAGCHGNSTCSAACWFLRRTAPQTAVS